MKFSPGCRCCGCKIWEDPWESLGVGTFVGAGQTEVAGDWTYQGGGRIGTSDNGAILRVDKSVPLPAIVRVKTRPGIGFDETREVRVAFGYLDPNNYHYLEFIIGCGAGFPDDQLILLRIGHRSSGSDTVLAKFWYDEPDIQFDCNSLSQPAFQLALCYDGEFLWGSVGEGAGADVIAAAVAAEDFAGSRVALIVIDAHGTRADFEDLEIYRVATEARPDCETCADNCCNGPVPEELIVEVVGTYYNSLGSPLTQIPGTYVIHTSVNDTCTWDRYDGDDPLIGASRSGDVLSAAVSKLGLGAYRFEFEKEDVPERCVDWDGLELPLTDPGSGSASGDAKLIVSVP